MVHVLMRNCGVVTENGGFAVQQMWAHTMRFVGKLYEFEYSASRNLCSHSLTGAGVAVQGSSVN